LLVIKIKTPAMYNSVYETEQGILNLKRTLKKIVDNRETIINQIGLDEFKKQTEDVIDMINDMTKALLVNSLLN